MRVKSMVRLLRRVGLVVPVVVWIAGCGAEQVAETGEQPQDAQTPNDQLILASARVAMPPADYMPADLPDPDSQGAQLMAQYCVACHAVPSPTTHSATDWPIVLRRMWLRTELLDTARFTVPVPSNAERIVIQRYLLDHALQVTSASLPEAPGKDTFVRTCSQCHALPDPKQHSSDDWVAVVTRMSGRMEHMLGAVPPRRDVEQIVNYLEGASRS